MQELNDQSVLGDSTVDVLLSKLIKSQTMIEKYIVMLSPETGIPYRKNAQKYTPAHHLEVSAYHFTYHTKHIQQALKTGKIQ